MLVDKCFVCVIILGPYDHRGSGSGCTFHKEETKFCLNNCKHLASTSIYVREENFGRNLVLSTFMKKDIDWGGMKIDTISSGDALSSMPIPMVIT